MTKFTSPHKKLRITVVSDDIEMIKGKAKLIPGKCVQFENGLFVTDDEKLIEFLKNYSGFGKDVFCEEEDVEKAVEKAKEIVEKPKEEQLKEEK
jgi:peptidyl-tRNA hydrolase